MRRRVERRIEGYGDGALSQRERARVERRDLQDAEGERHLRQTGAIGELIREAWNEGPPSPSPEYVIAALRPAMAAVDAERAAAPLRERALEHLASFVRPRNVALVGAVAAAVFLLLPSSAPRGPQPAPGELTARTVAPAAPLAPEVEPVAFAQLPAIFEDGVALNVGVPQAIYDLAQGETPLMLFEADDGATVIWLLDDVGLSGALPGVGGWA